MNILQFPTDKERLMRYIKKEIEIAIQVIDEPMRSEVVSDIVTCADKYLPDDPTTLSFKCAPFTDDQQDSISESIEVMMNDIGKKFAGLLMEYALLRVEKASCEMLHW